MLALLDPCVGKLLKISKCHGLKPHRLKSVGIVTINLPIEIDNPTNKVVRQ